MPSKSARQQRFFYSEQARAEKGERTQTGMTLGQINDFTRLDKSKKKGKK